MCKTQFVVALVVLYAGLTHSWDIAVSHGDLLEFYTNDIITDSIRFNSHNLAAMAYDEVDNMLLYVDKQSDNDTICGYGISSKVNQCFIERNGRNIRGLSFDPATELLFFSDINERSINWISLKSGSNIYGNLLIKMDHGIPTDIAVDSCKGYVYWINTNLTTPTIERARFNGSEREVVINSKSWSINTTYKLEPHSLTIDQHTQKIYWVEPKISSSSHSLIYYMDLNGKNKVVLCYINFDDEPIHNPSSNTITVSKTTLFRVRWCSDCEMKVSKLGKIDWAGVKTLGLHTKNVTVGIAANYKIEERIPGIRDCEALTCLTYLKRKEFDGLFCVHGVKVIGQSLCKCRAGYIGERCEVSVCENYCMHGNCSVNDEGFSKCSCNAGYSGERCEVDRCHGYCLNNGVCSLNEKSEPVCQCKSDHTGDRCEVSDCLNYCIKGNCSFSDEGLPKCSCNAGYSGERCEVTACQGYCLNNGICSLNEKNEPVCQCKGDHTGERCEVSDCVNYCIQGNCSLSDEGLPKCSCNAGFSGERCEVTACQGYCLNNGICSLNEKNEPICQCKGDHTGERCEVSDCVNYCLQGNCSLSDEGLPKCSCNAGFSGERCEVAACQGYCLNNGVCSLNEEDEPSCECVGKYKGLRCESVQTVTFTFTNIPTDSADTNPTLADVLSNVRKSAANIFVIVDKS